MATAPDQRTLRGRLARLMISPLPSRQRRREVLRLAERIARRERRTVLVVLARGVRDASRLAVARAFR